MINQQDVVNEINETKEEMDPTGGLAVIAPGTPIAPAHGIAAIALNMAMKFHDINMVKDGVLYQQYKLEGKNLRALHLDEVFETAIRIEMHLLGSSQRIAAVVVDAITHGIENDDIEDNKELEDEPTKAGDEDSVNET